MVPPGIWHKHRIATELEPVSRKSKQACIDLLRTVPDNDPRRRILSVTVAIWRLITVMHLHIVRSNSSATEPERDLK